LLSRKFRRIIDSPVSTQLQSDPADSPDSFKGQSHCIVKRSGSIALHLHFDKRESPRREGHQLQFQPISTAQKKAAARFTQGRGIALDLFLCRTAT
jgi:hypothetical protein